MKTSVEPAFIWPPTGRDIECPECGETVSELRDGSGKPMYGQHVDTFTGRECIIGLQNVEGEAVVVSPNEETEEKEE